MGTSRFLAAVAFSVCLASPSYAAVNLISNGSFENGSFTGAPFDTLTAVSTAITDWTVTGGSIDWIGSYWQPGPDGGSRSLDLNGLSPGTIASTTFVTVPGQQYEVSFYIAGNPDAGPPVKLIDVSTTSSSVNTFSFDTTGFSRSNMGWSLRSFTFVALGTSESLNFASATLFGGTLENPAAFGPAIDVVSVSAVPEPSTWALMLLGFAGVGYMAYRRAKKNAAALAVA